MCFEFLTMVPFDLDGVVSELMSVRERNLLNDYHAQVYEKISPYLNEEEKEWLKDATGQSDKNKKTFYKIKRGTAVMDSCSF